MTWVSKFSGLPTLTDIPDAADSYAAGVFSMDTATSAVNRDWNSTGGNTNAPRAYVSLATIGAETDNIIRVTARCSVIGVVAELNHRRGVALYGPNADDAALSFIVEADVAGSPGVGSGYGRAEENGVTADLGPDALTSCGVPNQFRIYWNGNDEAFEIPDSGFGSHSVPAHTASYWYSEDDGTTWVRAGDRTIDSGVDPDKAAIWAGIDASAGETVTATFTTLDVDEFNHPPRLQNKNPDDGETYHDVAQNIYLEAVDLYGDLDESTIEIWFNQDLIWSGDAAQPGFSVTKVAVPNGASYEFDPASDLDDGRTYVVRAYAEDLLAQSVDETWYFTAGDLRIGAEEDAEENHPGAAPQSVMGFQDGDALGDSIVDMLGPPNATGGHWLPGIGGPVDMPGPPGKASFSISYGSFDRDLSNSPRMGFADYDLYGFHIGIAGPQNFFMAILPDKPAAVNHGSGISIQGPLLKQAENFEDPAWHDHAGFDDGCDFPRSCSGREYHNYPQLARGIVLYEREAVDGRDPPQDEAGIEDGTFYSLADVHEYTLGVLDTDGNELASGYGIENVQAFADIDQDDWASPAAGFYGFAKDGTLYHNGLSTQPGVFGAGASQFNRRGWSDNQGLLAAGSIDGDAAMIGADQLRINSAALNGTEGINSALRWWLPSDFEVTVEWSGFAADAASSAQSRFSVIFDDGYAVYVCRRGDGYYERQVKINGSWGDSVTVATAATSGSFKISRSGSTVHTYYYSGGWIEIGSGVDMTRSDPGFASLYNSGSTNNVDITWSNFQIASGGWTNAASWADEAFSTERGNQDSFPDNVLVMGTEIGLDIIDTDNDLLWMRFLHGDGKALHDDLYKPLDSAFKDGLLVLAGNAESNNDGGITIVDFNLDTIRTALEDASSATGGFHDAPSGQSCLQGKVPGIVHRNVASGFTDDYARWSTGPSNSYNPHNAVDLLLSGGNVYIAGGSNGGLYVFRYPRWSMDDWITDVDASSWLENMPVYWVWFRPQDDMLFWTADDAGEITLYAQALSSIELPMHGGNFLAANSKVLAGLQNYPGQYRPAINGSDVYVAAEDAVWKMSWPGSSWTRFLGRPGSGATHEELPEGLTRITTVRYAKDGSIDLLVVGVDTGVTSQVLIYRLDFGTLYAKTKLIGARSNTSLTAAE